MGKAKAKRERKQPKRKRYSSPAVGVSAVAKAGKRRRGSSAMSGNAKVRKVRTVAANVTRDQIKNALTLDPTARAHINSRGIVKQLDYREGGTNAE